MTEKGFKPNMHFLDNEAPELLKQYNETKKITFKLAPPNSHIQNAAERAIKNWKNHFITRLSKVYSKLPMHLWDHLVQQSIITLNGQIDTIHQFQHMLS